MKRVFILWMAVLLVGTAGSARAKGTTGAMGGVETRLQGFVSGLDEDATRVGDATFAERFATQFNVTKDVLSAQRTQFNAGWSDLYLAYSIAAASKTTVTIDDIFALRTSGQSWTQIARSLQIPPGRLMRSVRGGVQTLTADASTGGASGRSSGSATGQTKSIKGIDRRLDTRLQGLDDEASRLGDQAIADRIAQDFGVTSDVVLSQKTQFNSSWGDLLTAYTIQSKSKTTVTIDQVFDLRSSGQTWTQIARSLKIPPGQLLRGISTESKTLGGSQASLHGKGGGTGTAMKLAHGGGAAAKVSHTATLVHGQGAMMKAARTTTTMVHGKK